MKREVVDTNPIIDEFPPSKRIAERSIPIAGLCYYKEIVCLFEYPIPKLSNSSNTSKAIRGPSLCASRGTSKGTSGVGLVPSRVARTPKRQETPLITAPVCSIPSNFYLARVSIFLSD